MKNEFSFENKLAFVTGGGSGIGKATAIKLATLGCNVIVADLNKQAADSTVSAINSQGYKAQSIELDVANREQFQLVAETVISNIGIPEIVINNAGVGLSGSILDMELKDWDWILSINLMGVIHGCHFFAKYMKDNGSGHIVNLASAMAYFYRDTEIAYVTTKAAVLAFSRSLGPDLARFNIGVTAVCPGIINTPIISATRFKGEMANQKTVETIKKLFSKYGHPPERVAKAIIYAIKHNISLMPVGFESYLAYVLDKLLPPSFYSKLISRRIEL